MAKAQKQQRRGIVLGETALRVGNPQEQIQLVDGFGVTVNGLVRHGNPSYEECVVAASMLKTTERAIQFAIGDFLNYLDEHMGERAHQIIDYSEGWSEKTCAVYSWLAKRIDPERRRMDRLTIRHHLLVAALTPTQQTRWLTEAAADDQETPWTVARLKAAIEANEDQPPLGWWVLVLATDEADQTALMTTLEGQNRTCKAVMRRRKS